MRSTDISVSDPRAVNIQKYKQFAGLVVLLEKRIDVKNSYLKLSTLSTFFAVYLASLLFQRDIGAAFGVQSSAFETNIIGSLPAPSGGRAGMSSWIGDGSTPLTSSLLNSRSDIIEWLGNTIIPALFQESLCGDGTCDNDERRSIGRFGCDYAGPVCRTADLFPNCKRLQFTQRLTQWSRKSLDIFFMNLELLYSSTTYGGSSSNYGAYLFEEHRYSDNYPHSYGQVDVEKEDELTLHLFQSWPVNSSWDMNIDDFQSFFNLLPSSMPEKAPSAVRYAYGEPHEVLHYACNVALGVYYNCRNDASSTKSTDCKGDNYPGSQTYTLLQMLRSYGLYGDIWINKNVLVPQPTGPPLPQGFGFSLLKPCTDCWPVSYCSVVPLDDSAAIQHIIDSVVPCSYDSLRRNGSPFTSSESFASSRRVSVRRSGRKAVRRTSAATESSPGSQTSESQRRIAPIAESSDGIKGWGRSGAMKGTELRTDQSAPNMTLAAVYEPNGECWRCDDRNHDGDCKVDDSTGLPLDRTSCNDWRFGYFSAASGQATPEADVKAARALAEYAGALFAVVDVALAAEITLPNAVSVTLDGKSPTCIDGAGTIPPEVRTIQSTGGWVRLVISQSLAVPQFEYSHGEVLAVKLRVRACNAGVAMPGVAVLKLPDGAESLNLVPGPVVWKHLNVTADMGDMNNVETLRANVCRRLWPEALYADQDVRCGVQLLIEVSKVDAVWEVALTVLMQSNGHAARARILLDYMLAEESDMARALGIVTREFALVWAPATFGEGSSKLWGTEWKASAAASHGCITHEDCADGLFCSKNKIVDANTFLGSFGCDDCKYCMMNSDAVDLSCPKDRCGKTVGRYPQQPMCINATSLFKHFQCSGQFQLNMSVLRDDVLSTENTSSGNNASSANASSAAANGIGTKKGRARFLTPFNMLIGAMVVTQARVAAGEYKVQNPSVQSYSENREGMTVQATNLDPTPFGVDPAFFLSSSLFQGDLNPEEMYTSSERSVGDHGQPGAPFGFFPYKYNGKNPHASDGGKFYNATGNETGMKDTRLLNDGDGDLFRLYFDERIDNAHAKRLLTVMVDGGFLDEYTKQVTVEMITVNVELNMFAHFEFIFDFQTNGKIQWDYKFGVVPIVLYPSSTSYLTGRYLMELTCVIFLAMNCILELIGSVSRPIMGKPQGSSRVPCVFALTILSIWRYLLCIQRCVRVGESAHADIVHAINSFRLKAYVTNFWNAIDWLHFGLMFYAWALWLSQISANNAFSLEPAYHVLESPSTNTRARMFKTNAEEEAKLLALMDGLQRRVAETRMYSSITSMCVLLFVVRMLKAMHFQPKMALITRTIGNAFGELIHFAVLFVFVLVGFSTVGHLLFGEQREGFAKLSNAMLTLFCSLVALDPPSLFTHVTEEILWTFHIFFWTWLCLAYFILLNILLAILVEGFMSVKQAIEHDGSGADMISEVAEILGHELQRLVKAVKPSHPFISDEALLTHCKAAMKSEIFSDIAVKHLAKTDYEAITNSANTLAIHLSNGAAPIDRLGLWTILFGESAHAKRAIAGRRSSGGSGGNDRQEAGAVCIVEGGVHPKTELLVGVLDANFSDSPEERYLNQLLSSVLLRLGNLLQRKAQGDTPGKWGEDAKEVMQPSTMREIARTLHGLSDAAKGSPRRRKSAETEEAEGGQDGHAGSVTESDHLMAGEEVVVAAAGAVEPPTVSVSVVALRGLPRMDIFRGVDAFCAVFVEGSPEVWQTSIRRGRSEAQWQWEHEPFMFRLEEGTGKSDGPGVGPGKWDGVGASVGKKLVVMVYDKDQVSTDDLVGCVYLPLEEVVATGGRFDGWRDITLTHELTLRQARRAMWTIQTGAVAKPEIHLRVTLNRLDVEAEEAASPSVAPIQPEVLVQQPTLVFSGSCDAE